jgi:hypothetical protein
MIALTEDQPTVVEESPAEPRGSLREWWVPLGLVLGGGVWNLLVEPLGDMAFTDDGWSMLICFAMGSLLVQPLLCAVWGAFAAHAWFWRLLLATAASCFLGLMMTTDGDVLNVLILLMGLYFVFLVPLALSRWKFRVVLSAKRPSMSASPSSSSFGLGYLFAWMSVVAVLTGLARWIAGVSEQINPSSKDMAIFALMFFLLLAPSAWLFLYLLRTSPIRWRTLMLIASTIPLATLCATFVYMQFVPGTAFGDEGFWPLLFYCLGAMFAVALVAFALRWAGYRLTRLAPNS